MRISEAGEQNRFRRAKIAARELVSYYRALSAMMSAGVPLFAIFEFLSRSSESKELSLVSQRIARRLVSGMSLVRAVSPEDHCFDQKSCQLLQAGVQSGSLERILARLAQDEESTWKLKQKVLGQLVYPCCIALLTLLGVVVLPPLVMADFLVELVKLTGEPPLLTRVILQISQALAQPLVWVLGGSFLTLLLLLFRRQRKQAVWDLVEPMVWEVPKCGELWQDIVAIRFLQTFSSSYEAGLPATASLELAASSTGSLSVHRAGKIMKTALISGDSLTESLRAGGFLPPMALEAAGAGEQSGSLPLLLLSASKLLQAEVETRIESVTKLIEPLVLLILGSFVGLFALGCLLPIISLTENL